MIQKGKPLQKFKLEHWVITAIVLLSLFLRLYRISDYMTFLGDEGRDALVWLRMLHGKFTLIGPQTSIGNMYLGPLYYYLMFPFYVLLGTAGPSIGVALFAGATTYLLWFFSKEWFSKETGFLAAFFYAISPVAIELSRSSWNPNVMPFFSLMIVWGIWQFWQKNNYIWLAIEGILLSFAIQSHYLGLLLIPLVGIFWFFKLLELVKKKEKNLKQFLLLSIFLVLLFILLTLVPLIWFDFRHNFINSKAFYKFFSERQTTVNLKPYKALPEIWPLWKMLITRLVAGKNETFGFLISLILPIFGIFVWVFKRPKMLALKLVLAWVGIGILGMGLYKQHIYDHYFGFLFPAVFIILAIILSSLEKFKIYGKVLSLIFFLTVAFLSIEANPLKDKPNFQMKHTREISQKIILESGGKPFNLGMIAKQNYDAGYRYFLEKMGYKAVEIDPQRSQETITEQLFVVCEEEKCSPTTHPQAEIANFGWSKIEKEWQFPWGVKLYKLVHNVERSK